MKTINRKGANTTLKCGVCDAVLHKDCFEEFHQIDGPMPPCYNDIRVNPGPRAKNCPVINEWDGRKSTPVLTVMLRREELIWKKNYFMDDDAKLWPRQKKLFFGTAT